MKFNFRKIASTLASATMVSSTVALAAAANFPAPYVENGAADVAIVYGSSAEISDLAAVGDISTYLASQLAAQTASGGSKSSGEGSGEDFVRLDKTSDRLNLGNALSGPFGTTVDDDDMTVLLADGVYTADDSDDFDYEQKITLGSVALAHFRDSDYEDVIGASERTPTIGFNFSSDAFVLNYTLDFLDQAESDIVSGDLDDIEASDIPLLGRTYYVSDAKSNTTAGSTLGKFTLLDSANKALVSEGETVTVEAGGQSYDVSISFISSSEVKLTIGGETTDSLTEGQTEKLSDGSYVGIRDITKLEVSGETGSVEFSIGSGKLELTSGQDIELNDDAINDVKAYVYQGTGTSSTNKIDKIVIEWKTDNEEFITSESELVMPGFGALKFSMNDLVRNEEEMVTVDNDGEDSVQLKAPIEDGDVSLNLLYANATGEFTGIGKDSETRLATDADGSITFWDKYSGSNYHEYMVASYNTSNDAESYLLSFKVNEDTSAGRNETTVKNEVTGDTWSERTAGDVFTIGDVSFTIASIGKNSTDEWVTLTAGTNVNFNTLFTKGGLKVYLPWEDDTITAVAGSSFTQGAIDFDDTDVVANATDDTTGHNSNIFHLYMDGENKDDDIAGGTQFYLTLNDNSDGELQVTELDGSGSGGPNGKELGNSNTYEAYIVDDVAPKVVHYTDPDQDWAEVYYPMGDSETYAEVFLSAADADTSAAETVVTGGTVTELGSVSVTDSAVGTVSGKNLIVVGGSCVNTVAASLLGGAGCGESWVDATGVNAGSFLIETFDRGDDTVATLVAGYLASDTTNAAKALTTQTIDTDVGMKYTGTSASSVSLVSEDTDTA